MTSGASRRNVRRAARWLHPSAQQTRAGDPGLAREIADAGLSYPPQVRLRRSTRWLIAAAVGIALIPQNARTQQSETTISGRVVAEENAAALPRARITSWVANKRVAAVFADDRGRFTMTVPPNTAVTLTITKAGFARAQRALGPAPSEPQRVEGRDRRPEELRIGLNRSASIWGRVATPSGEPVIDANFIAVPATALPNSKMSPLDTFNAATNDLGEFRFGGLPQGRYQVMPDSPANDRPSSTVDVRAGDETGPIDIVYAPPERTRRPLTPAAMTRLRAAGAIRGRVVGATKRPISGARVRVMRPGYGGDTAVFSDEQGRFGITGLPSGSYAVEASKSGYVTVQYGQTRAAEPGLQLTLRENAVLDDIVVTLPRGSAVTGMIADEHGEPLEGVGVRALQVRYANGRTSALAAPGVREVFTDDRGRYRLFGLLPGSYLVAASVEATITSADASGYAPIFHPGSTQVSEAVPVQADIGRDVPGIDLVFHRVSAARVAGVVRGSSGAPADARVLIVASQRSGAIALEPRQASATGGDGSFAVANVPPGDYVVQAFSARVRGREPEFGVEFVTVGESDPKPIAVRMSRGTALEGRLVLEGNERADGTVAVSAMPADFDYAPIIGGGPSGGSRVLKGVFTIPNLFGPTRFRITGRPDWYLKSVSIDGLDVTDTPFDFGLTAQTVRGAEIVASNAGGVITGHVTDARSAPVRDYAVVVFSTERTKWFANSRFLKLGRPSQDGTFEVVGLPPGEYWVAAVDSIQGNQSFGEWEKPDVLEALSTRATRVTLTERERSMVMLRLIRR
jgi:Carboxypeptidase regulatory-like domain